MKLEYITVDSIKSGMKEVAARFGADAVLVKAIADGDKQKLLIAHDNQVRMSSPLPRSESQQSVEQKLNEPKIKNKDVEHSTLEAQIAAMKEKFQKFSAEPAAKKVKRNEFSAQLEQKVFFFFCQILIT